MLLGACNHPEKLDPALVRSGRLDRHIMIELPDRASLALILREQLGSDLPEDDLSHAATMAAGATGADCERMVRGARRRARAADRDVKLPDLMAEISGSESRSPADTLVAATHEAGHAVAACVLQPGGLTLVSLRASGDRGGHMKVGYSSEFTTAADIYVRLKVVLSGRAAEEVILGRPSSGAGGDPGSDLSVATRVATIAAVAFGFDGVLGLTWRGMPDRATLPGFLKGNGNVDASVTQILQHAYEDALALMVERRSAVEAVAQRLTEHTVLDGTTVQAIVDDHRLAETLHDEDFIIYGEPHGVWRPLLAACCDDLPDGVIILGDFNLSRPMTEQLASLFEAEIKVRRIPGNHDCDFATPTRHPSRQP